MTTTNTTPTGTEAGFDLDNETLWEIHGAVKNAGSTRLANKIADYIARRAAPATTDSESIGDSKDFLTTLGLYNCGERTEKQLIAEIDTWVKHEARASLAPVSAQQGAAEQHNAVECDSALRAEPARPDFSKFATYVYWKAATDAWALRVWDYKMVGATRCRAEGGDTSDKDTSDLAAKAPAAQAVAINVFTCKGKGGEYELVGYSNGAGLKRGESIVVYRDTAKADILYHRSRKDFEERMEWLGARAASPASTPEAAPEQQQAVSKRAGFDEAMQAQHGGTLTKEDLDTCWSELPGYAWRRAADAAHAQQPAAPEGWKMVPIVPTDWMIEKAASLPSNGTFNYEIYQAMVNAAPTAGAATTSEDARDAARYRGWRDHMLAEDKAFVDAMQDFMPPDVGASRDPTASEWDFAIDAAMRATQQEGE